MFRSLYSSTLSSFWFEVRGIQNKVDCLSKTRKSVLFTLLSMWNGLKLWHGNVKALLIEDKKIRFSPVEFTQIPKQIFGTTFKLKHWDLPATFSRYFLGAAFHKNYSTTQNPPIYKSSFQFIVHFIQQLLLLFDLK